MWVEEEGGFGRGLLNGGGGDGGLWERVIVGERVMEGHMGGGYGIDVITVTGSIVRTIRLIARGRVVMISIIGVVRVSVSMSNVCDVMLPMCDGSYCECEVGWGGV